MRLKHLMAERKEMLRKIRGAPMAKLVQFEYQNKKYTLDYNPLNKIRIYQFILNICKYINEREAQ